MIIGLSGTLGSGKGEVAKYLVSKGFVHYSVTQVLIEEIKKRNLIVNRDSMYSVANDLRNSFGAGILAKRLLEKAKFEGNTNIIIESLRNPKEIVELRKFENVFIFAVDADRKIRYDRIQMRHSSKDNISYDNFSIQEENELNNSDPNAGHISECMKIADIIFQNNSSLLELYKQIDNFFESHLF